MKDQNVANHRPSLDTAVPSCLDFGSYLRRASEAGRWMTAHE